MFLMLLSTQKNSAHPSFKKLSSHAPKLIFHASLSHSVYPVPTITGSGFTNCRPPVSLERIYRLRFHHRQSLVSIRAFLLFSLFLISFLASRCNREYKGIRSFANMYDKKLTGMYTTFHERQRIGNKKKWLFKKLPPLVQGSPQKKPRESHRGNVFLCGPTSFLCILLSYRQ